VVPEAERASRSCNLGIEVEPQMGAEDFAFYAQRVPGFYLKLGVRNERKGLRAMVHSEDFTVSAVLNSGSTLLAAQAAGGNASRSVSTT
jgi:metal-dependent amidase/aminoacylase/carboxypeptidase family protein